METSYGPDPNQPRLVLLLLGERGSGKSSAGNGILGKVAFHKNTSHSCRASASTCGRQVTVVDTPGWSSHSSTPAQLTQELCRGLALCHQDPHGILLVLPITSTFGPEELSSMETQLRALQTSIWERALVLFTQGDQLGGVSIQEHIQRQGLSLRSLLDRCGNRYQVWTNQSRISQDLVLELLEKIQKMVETNERPQLRRDMSVKETRRTLGGGEEVEMTVMQPGRRHLSREAGLLAASRPDLGLVLLGRRKSGKSSAGNMILGRDEFRVGVKTRSCCVGRGEASGRPLTVVDTPGWSLFGLADPRQVRSEISRSPSFCPETSRVLFLLVVPVDSFKEKDRKAMETHLAILGGDVWRSSVVLFTHGDELRGRTVEQHVDRSGDALQRLLDRCDRRHHVLDTNTGGRTEVNQLLDLLEQL